MIVEACETWIEVPAGHLAHVMPGGRAIAHAGSTVDIMPGGFCHAYGGARVHLRPGARVCWNGRPEFTGRAMGYPHDPPPRERHECVCQ